MGASARRSDVLNRHRNELEMKLYNDQRAHDKVITYSMGYLSQGVCRARRDEHDVGPATELDV